MQSFKIEVKTVDIFPPDVKVLKFEVDTTTYAYISLHDHLVVAVNSWLVNNKDRIGNGQLLSIHGVQSPSLCFVIAHAVCHLFGAVAVHHQELGGSIIVISHDPSYRIGDIFPI